MSRKISKPFEDFIGKLLDIRLTPNSGASMYKGDLEGEYILLEAKTVKERKESIAIKKSWLTKIKGEAIQRGKQLYGLVYSYDNISKSKEDIYFVLDKKTFMSLYNAWLEINEKGEDE